MANSTPTEVVDGFIAAIEAKDLEGAGGFVADDLYYDNVPVGDMTGRDAMLDFLKPMLSGDGPVEFEVLRQTATGNMVMNERVDRFHTGSGRQVELPVMGVFEVNDGLITFWRDYFDNATFMRQIKGS